MKRSLGPTHWQTRRALELTSNDSSAPQQPTLIPLREGPAMGPEPKSKAFKPQAPEASSNPNPSQQRPYARGSLRTAMDLATSAPTQCRDNLREKIRSDTAIRPQESRERTWHDLATAAGIGQPFSLDPNTIFTVMGILDQANYRSAELYLDAAKQRHIELGYGWSHQLAQAARQARRACRRGRGPAKQAQPLPFKKVVQLKDQPNPSVSHGPCYPIRSTLLASWWLLREIEASNAQISHISIDQQGKLARACPRAKPTRKLWAPPGLTPAAARKHGQTRCARSIWWSINSISQASLHKACCFPPRTVYAQTNLAGQQLSNGLPSALANLWPQRQASSGSRVIQHAPAAQFTLLRLRLNFGASSFSEGGAASVLNSTFAQHHSPNSLTFPKRLQCQLHWLQPGLSLPLYWRKLKPSSMTWRILPSHNSPSRTLLIARLLNLWYHIRFQRHTPPVTHLF